MAARKVLTRAESQAQTRQELLDAAARMFLEGGYHATSIAAIAAEAGRTIGAVYSNFESKEVLCLEVLKSRYAAEATSLMAALVATDGSLEERLAAISTWWSILSGDFPLSVLAAEYTVSTLRNPDQRQANMEAVDRFLEWGRVLMEEQPEGESVSDTDLDDAVLTACAMGIGLAAGQAMGMLDAERSAALLVSTVRLYLNAQPNSSGPELSIT
ncbi:TetR/AcrR family transcriptional regulator [Mycobacteroides chelonae]|uniref:TetR/AcrR family transcriptional regulator n=1 Tax=Mycobacteroides chelonae TaxID=1774 RepID=UPI0009C0F975|nr:TetR/AcrR family transcriptional regulator [Mycobacteroides chelonae]QQG86642.1 TetR/AcrR family transcriptional regulator [Mycobacteroides chelonae]QQG91459.1 TetR/AcrR family transcriptional regulator [Mycobacteroides chelonae]